MTARRLFAFWPLAAGFLVLFVYAALWRAGAAEMRRAIDDWAEEQRAQGLSVTFDRVSVTGFPFILRGDIRDAAIAVPEGLSWRAERLMIDASLISPRALIFRAPQTQSLDLGRAGAWRMTTPTGRTRIASASNGSWSLEVQSGASRLERTDKAQAISTQKTRLIVAPDQDAPSQINVALTLDDLSFTGGVAPLRIEKIEAGLAIVLDPRLSSVAAIEPGAPAPRIVPGAVKINKLHIEAEGARLAATGTITLDREGYPSGVLDAEIINPGGFASLLGKAGALSPEEVEQARAGLTLAAIANGGKLSAPLVLKDGAAQIAGVAVAKLPHVGFEEEAPQP